MVTPALKTLLLTSFDNTFEIDPLKLDILPVYTYL